MRMVSASGLAIALQLAAAPAIAQRLPFEKSIDAAGISTVDVSTIRGKINVVSGGTGRIVIGGAVTVRVGLSVPANAVQLAQKIAANPPIERAGDAVRLRPPSDATARRAVTVNYEVRVPSNTTIIAVSDSGEISVDSLSGPVNVRTQSGAIELNRIGGAAVVASGSGAVIIDGAKGSLTVTTSSSAFTGRAIGGALRARTVSGMVDARFEGGGDVDVETGSSAIRLDGVRGALTTVTRSGHITVEGTPDRQWSASTGSGSIDVAIPNAPVRVDATSGSGSVQVIGASVNGTVSKRAVAGTIGGGGPVVRITTRSGSVRLTVGR